jgi:hypothetical protein
MRPISPSVLSHMSQSDDQWEPQRQLLFTQAAGGVLCVAPQEIRLEAPIGRKGGDACGDSTPGYYKCSKSNVHSAHSAASSHRPEPMAISLLR